MHSWLLRCVWRTRAKNLDYCILIHVRGIEVVLCTHSDTLSKSLSQKEGLSA